MNQNELIKIIDSDALDKIIDADNSEIVKTISIIANGDIRNIVLNDLQKSKITFGRDKSNDIVLPYSFISKFHGYFELVEDTLKIVDNNSKNGLFINEKKEQEKILNNNDFIRIDNTNKRIVNGVLILIRYGQNLKKWSHYKLEGKSLITIGNSSKSDILVSNVNLVDSPIELKKNGKDFILKTNTNEVYVNNNLVNDSVVLNNNDVIFVNGSFLIYSNKEIFYQAIENGVRVDARGVYKTVKIKGKPKDISQNVNMTIYPGEFVAFIGGSGAGKSTFMKMICGLSKPTKGKIYINGEEIFENYDSIKKNIGYVPQDDIVFTNLTLVDMLNYSANLRMPKDSTPMEKERRIREVLEIVDLTGKENVLIKRLSGGQRKRASIAVELLADPRLFFLDEPTSGLDPGTERSIMKTLRKMANSGQTVILVTHNTLNIHLCDKVVFFGEGGRVCYDGPAEGAKTFFGVDDYVDIYTLIDKDLNKWHTKYLDNLVIDDVDIKKPPGKGVLKNKGKEKTKKKINNNASIFQQFITLTSRYLKTIVNNKFQILLLLFQAPIIALALTLVMNNDLFEYYDITKAILFSISIAAIYIGLGNSIQEICKEKVILQKEYMANLNLFAYLSSKVVVLLLLSIIQAFLFVLTISFLVEVPVDGVIFSWKMETIIEMALTIFSASSIGLVVSSLSSDSSIAMTYIPLLLVPQMLFSGMLFELKSITNALSNIILCRWSLELLGTTNDMNNLVSTIQDIIPEYKRESEVFFEFTKAHFYGDLGIILIMSLVCIIVCYTILRSQLEVKK